MAQVNAQQRVPSHRRKPKSSGTLWIYLVSGGRQPGLNYEGGASDPRLLQWCCLRALRCGCCFGFLLFTSRPPDFFVDSLPLPSLILPAYCVLRTSYILPFLTFPCSFASSVQLLPAASNFHSAEKSLGPAESALVVRCTAAFSPPSALLSSRVVAPPDPTLHLHNTEPSQRRILQLCVVGLRPSCISTTATTAAGGSA